jgi:hypothetical protein
VSTVQVEHATAADWNRIDLLLRLMDHIEQIGLGETRASLLLAADAALAVAYLTVVDDMNLWTRFATLERGLLVCAWATLGLSVVLALWAIRPAHIVTEFGVAALKRLPDHAHVLSFYSIAAQTRDRYVAAFHDRSDRELQDELLRTIYGKSIKARQKFTDLLRAAVCLATSLAAVFVLALLALIKSLS